MVACTVAGVIIGSKASGIPDESGKHFLMGEAGDMHEEVLLCGER